MVRSTLIAAWLLTVASAVSAQSAPTSTPFSPGDPVTGVSRQQQQKICEDGADFFESTALARDKKIPMSEYEGHLRRTVTPQIMGIVEVIYASTSPPEVMKSHILANCEKSIK